MEIKLQNQLYNIDPLFFKEAILCQKGEMNEVTSCMAFGLECNDGWFIPIKKFILQVKHLNNIAVQQFNFYFICQQLKEKYGTLHLYWGTRIFDQSKEIIQNSVDRDSLTELFRNALYNCEQQCLHTCEICGAKQDNFSNVNIVSTSGWITYICDKCARENYDNTIKQFDEKSKKEYNPRVTNFAVGYYYLNPFDKKCSFTYRGNYYNNIFGAYLSQILFEKYHTIFNKELIKNISKDPYLSYLYIKDMFKDIHFFNCDELENIVFAKFNSNNKYKNVLLSTENKKLIWNNQICDNQLGCCICNECKNINSKNKYGEILEKIRKKIKQGEVDDLYK